MNIPHCREFQYEYVDIKIVQNQPHTRPHAPPEGSACVEARGNACHRLLGWLTGSALTGSALTGSGVDRSMSLTSSGR